jgi:hypothetical protein
VRFGALGMLSVLACCSFSGDVQATSFVPAKPHDSGKVCAALTEVLEMMIGKRRFDPRIAFYSNELGLVENREYAIFVKHMTSSNGRLDEQGSVIDKVYLLKNRYQDHIDKIPPLYENREILFGRNLPSNALYIVIINREQWVKPQSFIGSITNKPERYENTKSYWLVQFNSNNISEIREGSIFSALADFAKPLRGCENG